MSRNYGDGTYGEGTYGGVPPSLYQNVVIADTPALYWPLNETSGNVVHDMSGNNRHGKFYEANQIWTPPGSGGLTLGQTGGTVGGDLALQLNGHWSNVNLWIAGTRGPLPSDQDHRGIGARADNYKPFQPGASITMECWCYKVDPYSYAAMFTGGAGGANAGDDPNPTLEWGTSGANGTGTQIARWYTNVNDAPGNWLDWGSSNTGNPRNDFTLNAWHHVVFTYNDATSRSELWVDGQSQGIQGPNGYLSSNAQHFAASAATTADFQIGFRGSPPRWVNPGNYEVWGGLMQHIAVYPRILGSAVIRSHFLVGSGSQAPVLARHFAGVINPGTPDTGDYVPTGLPGTNYGGSAYGPLLLDAAKGLQGTYAPSSKHIFNIPSATYERTGGHQFGEQKGVTQTVKLTDNLQGIASQQNVSVPALGAGAPTPRPTGIAPPAAATQVPGPVISGGGTIPTTAGLAMSQGPTGSMWGPDATPVSGKPAILPRNMAKGVGTQFAQAVDFAYAITINHKPDYVVSNQSQWDLAIRRAQEMGVMGFRLWLTSPTNDTDTNRQNIYQGFGIRVRTLSSAAQPMAVLWGVAEEPARMIQKYGSQQWNYTAQTHCRPLDHFTGPNPTAGQPGGGGGGNYQDVSWVSTLALMGPNEPDGDINNWHPESIRAIVQAQRAYKNTKANETAKSGLPYVDSNQGRLVPGPLNASQLPVWGSPTAHKENGFNNAWGDWTDGTVTDYGSMNIYFYHEAAAVPLYFGFDWSDDGSEFNSWLDHINGGKGPGRLKRTLPLTCTETGYVTAPGADPLGVGVQSTSLAPRYIPPEIAGVYTNHTMIQLYGFGIKAISLYRLTDENAVRSPGAAGEGFMETINNAQGQFQMGERKENFYAVKNLLRLIGRGQSSSPATGQPISVPLVTPFVPGADNMDPMVTGVHTPDCFWKLIFQQDDDTYIAVLARNRTMWWRFSQQARTVAPSDRFLAQLQLPNPGSGMKWDCGVAEPEKITVTALNDNNQTLGQLWPPNYDQASRRPLANPDDGQAYPNPGDGMKYDSVGIAGVDQIQPDVNNRVKISMAAMTRVFRFKRVPNNTGTLIDDPTWVPYGAKP